jgi:hypothetical protein
MTGGDASTSGCLAGGVTGLDCGLPHAVQNGVLSLICVPHFMQKAIFDLLSYFKIRNFPMMGSCFIFPVAAFTIPKMASTVIPMP